MKFNQFQVKLKSVELYNSLTADSKRKVGLSIISVLVMHEIWSLLWISYLPIIILFFFFFFSLPFSWCAYIFYSCSSYGEKKHQLPTAQKICNTNAECTATRSSFRSEKNVKILLRHSRFGSQPSPTLLNKIRPSVTFACYTMMFSCRRHLPLPVVACRRLVPPPSQCPRYPGNNKEMMSSEMDDFSHCSRFLFSSICFFLKWHTFEILVQ